MLGAYQAEFLPALEEVGRKIQVVLAEAVLSFDRQELTSTPRVKTVPTLIEKLRRGTSLASMQDIVGYRIVGPLSLSEQDAIAVALRQRFQGSELVDRRVRPSHGYRAVHLIVRPNGFQVEIQIRTRLQDIWANWIERLGDGWGRWLRYGLPAEGTDDEHRKRRSELIKLYETESDVLYELEQLMDHARVILRRLDEPDSRGLEESAEHATIMRDNAALMTRLDLLNARLDELHAEVGRRLPA